MLEPQPQADKKTSKDVKVPVDEVRKHGVCIMARRCLVHDDMQRCAMMVCTIQSCTIKHGREIWRGGNELWSGETG